jgi:hypothetical protein
VTLGGQPLVGVEVTFYPEAPGLEALPYSRAVTGPDGKFQLTCKNGREGAVVGTHRVTVVWPRPERNDEKPQPPASTPAIPVRYSVAGMTPLVKEVPAEGAPRLDLALDRQ